jgi:uncharacterized membrane protein
MKSLFAIVLVVLAVFAPAWADAQTDVQLMQSELALTGPWIAVHVYIPKYIAADDEAGGLHVAPILATAEDGSSQLIVQWWRTFWGYVVEVVEPALLLGLGLFALSLHQFARADRFLPAVAIACCVTAALRAQTAVLFLSGIETLNTYLVVNTAVLEPLALMVWTLALNRWVEAPDRRIDIGAALFGAAVALTGLGDGPAFETIHTIVRLGFFCLLAWGAVRAAIRGRHSILVVLAVTTVAVALFADELSTLGVPGIWFPFGVGVSRSQYALAISIPLLAVVFQFRAGRALHHVGGAPQMKSPRNPLSPVPLNQSPGSK